MMICYVLLSLCHSIVLFNTRTSTLLAAAFPVGSRVRRSRKTSDKSITSFLEVEMGHAPRLRVVAEILFRVDVAR